MAKQLRRAYGVVEADNHAELTQRVSAMMARGFTPLGGPAVTGTPGLVGSQGPKGSRRRQTKAILQRERGPPNVPERPDPASPTTPHRRPRW